MFIDVKKYLKEAHTDKEKGTLGSPFCRGQHHYGELYNLLFTAQYAKVNRCLSVLELGIFSGGSLHAWMLEDKICKIVGVDPFFPPRPSLVRGQHKKPYAQFLEAYEEADYCSIEKIDAYNDSAIELLAENYGTFDIIIDDGTHEVEAQEFMLTNYHKLLNDDGVLICEDIKCESMDHLQSIKDKYNLFIFDLNRNNDNSTVTNSAMIIRYKPT